MTQVVTWLTSWDSQPIYFLSRCHSNPLSSAAHFDFLSCWTGIFGRFSREGSAIFSPLHFFYPPPFLSLFCWFAATRPSGQGRCILAHFCALFLDEMQILWAHSEKEDSAKKDHSDEKPPLHLRQLATYQRYSWGYILGFSPSTFTFIDSKLTSSFVHERDHLS